MAGRKKQPELTAEEKLQQALVPEAEQPYKVPDNWCWTRLKNISLHIADGSHNPPKDSGSGVPLLSATNIHDHFIDIENATRWITKEEWIDENKRTKIEKNDILLTIVATIGRTAVVKNEIFALQRSVAVIKPKINSEFLSYYFETPYIQKFMLDNARGTAQKGFYLNSLQELMITLPPLAEQQRIVERIETLFAKLDEAKEKLQNTLDTFETRKAAILHKAFTGELTANWRKQYGLTIDSWEENTLNDIASYKKGPFGSSITKAMFVPKTANTYKVYEQGNVIRKDLTYGHYYITSEKYQELKGFSVKAGDILISCAGTIGEVYKLPPECEEGVINQALMRVRLNQNIIEGYFCYYFGEIIKDDVIDKSNGTAMKNIPPFKVLKAIQIKLPTINEQTEIVRIIDNLLAKEQQAHSIAQNAIAQIDLIKKSILARAFRGQLATNNPADEPAIELLKKVL